MHLNGNLFEDLYNYNLKCNLGMLFNTIAISFYVLIKKNLLNKYIYD